MIDLHAFKDVDDTSRGLKGASERIEHKPQRYVSANANRYATHSFQIPDGVTSSRLLLHASTCPIAYTVYNPRTMRSISQTSLQCGIKIGKMVRAALYLRRKCDSKRFNAASLTLE